MDDEDSLEWTEGLLDGIVEKVEREQAEAVARLRAQGIEPASRENQVYAGLPLVSFTLLPLDGTGIEVRLRFDDDAGETVLAWGEEWPLHGAPVDAAVLLDALAEHWPLVAGWTHVPRLVALPGGRLVVNPGSVGLPAYTDDRPHPHAMEAGSPHARYAVLEEREGGWTVELVAVPYPFQEAAATARRNGRADWAEWIATGRG